MPHSESEIGLIDQLSTGIAVIDGDDTWVHVNPALMEAAGWTGWRDRPAATLRFGDDDLVALTERARKNRAPLRLRDVDLRTGSTPVRCDIAISPIPQGALLELHTRTPHEPAEAWSRMSQSLRGLAHEMKNPLAGLRGAAQLLERRIDEPDLKRLAALIIAEADRLANLADRFLRPGGKPHLTAVNLHEVIERARALMTAEGDPALRVDRDYDPSLPAFLGDADRLLQLTLNLLRNAAQASAHAITVRTRAEHGAIIGGRHVRMALRMDILDDGAGVPEALRDTLFLPLVSGRDGGTGLGLAIAQEIAHEHGGQIACDSRPGRTVFSVLLPLEQAHG